MSITQEVLQKFGKQEKDSDDQTDQDDLDLSEPFKKDENGKLLGVPEGNGGKFGQGPSSRDFNNNEYDDYNQQKVNQSHNSSLNQSRSKRVRKSPNTSQHLLDASNLDQVDKMEQQNLNFIKEIEKYQ